MLTAAKLPEHTYRFQSRGGGQPGVEHRFSIYSDEGFHEVWWHTQDNLFAD